MSTHIPRRSGVGARQVLPPATPKRRRIRYSSGGPELCGAKHPDSDLTCDGRVHYQEAAAGAIISSLMGLPSERAKVDHAGKHRARPLVGVVIRWDDSEVPA